MVTLNRILFGTFAVFMAVLGAGIVMLMLLLFAPEPDTVLGPYQSPFDVITDPVIPGVPAVVRGERCVTSGRDEEVKATVILQQIGGDYRHIDLNGAKQTRLRGCNTTTQVVEVPIDAPDGRYIINGFSIATRTGENRGWWSEEFNVQRIPFTSRVSLSRASSSCGDETWERRASAP